MIFKSQISYNSFPYYNESTEISENYVSIADLFDYRVNLKCMINHNH